MSCTDKGIVIFKKVYGERYYIVTIFTMLHGNMRFLTRKSCNLFSIVQINYRQNCEVSLSFVRFIGEESFIDKIMLAELRMLLVQYMTSLVLKIFPVNLQNQKIFKFLEFIIRNLENFDKNDCINIIIYFELLFLKEAGFGLSLKKCCFCGKSSNLFYISSESGHAVCEQCRNLCHEKLLNLPHSLLNVNLNNFEEATTYRDGLFVTSHFIAKRFGECYEYAKNCLLEKVNCVSLRRAE